ncbi:hypothetical protein D3C76_1124310 [compost metagenome]
MEVGQQLAQVLGVDVELFFQRLDRLVDVSLFAFHTEHGVAHLFDAVSQGFAVSRRRRDYDFNFFHGSAFLYGYGAGKVPRSVVALLQACDDLEITEHKSELGEEVPSGARPHKNRVRACGYLTIVFNEISKIVHLRYP